MCGLCQSVNPFQPECLLDQALVADPLWQVTSEVVDAPNAVASFSGQYTISVGDTFNGFLTADDIDIVAITLDAGVDYTFRVAPSDSEFDDVLDSHLTVFSNTGSPLALNDDINYSAGDFYSAIHFSPVTSGTYYLGVTTYRTQYNDVSAPIDVGHYTLTTKSQGASAGLQEYNLNQIAHQLSYVGWGNTTYKWNVAAGGSLTVNLDGLTAEGKTLARMGLEAWEAVSGLTFNETSGSAQITFDDNNNGAYANFSISGGSISTANINVSTSWINSYGTGLNSYSFQTYIHEIGHALGLAHAGQYNGSATFGVSNHYLNDSWQSTVMSYFNQNENTHVDASHAWVITPQIADILAIQNMYGAAGTLRTGDTTYGANSNVGGYYDQLAVLNSTAFTILDDGGTDTFDASTYSGAQRVDLRSETFSDVFGETGNLAIARGTVLENYEGGSGVDLVLGNNVNNVIRGHNGDDEVYGQGGDDALFGGAGNDRLVGNEGNDTLTGGDGADILKGKDGNNALYGGTGDDRLFGSDTGNDSMLGEDGSDILIGLGGIDLLNGGNGQDFLYGGLGTDILIGGADDDRIRGNRDNDLMIGGTGSDSLFGGANADTLQGGDDKDYLLGESGNDRLDGGLGNDKLSGGSGTDVFVFKPGYGFDLVNDFEDGVDVFDLTDFAFTNMSDLYLSETGSAVRISFGNGDVLYVDNTSLTNFQDADFLF